uniref:guanylate cyclase n=1 Tax=Corethron hystrix TaxID=216773 RepID=A0A7S1G0J5_9STRA|mmetsp:Transcript_7546/g.16359  ORF Transcript_7546/g.16359 Transcript_7546/m.16359 type:complete len:990 (+) Transcript_7546:582-3551(+)
MNVFFEGLTFSDVAGPDYDTHETAFIRPNLPGNNPGRTAFFTAPYPDIAQAGKSIITASAPIYFTGEFYNHTFNETYIASTGLDISVASISSLLDVLTDNLAKGSFAVLVDSKFNIIVASQTAVNILYPKRTGLEEERVTYSAADGSVVEDRRNVTYLVSDTIFQDLTELKNADWTGLRSKILKVRRGGRDFSTLKITRTGETRSTDFYVMYERWEYVADWILMAFAPTYEVKNAINISFYQNSTSNNVSSIVLEGEMGNVLVSEIFIVNRGSMDVSFRQKAVPKGLSLNLNESNKQILQSGSSFPLQISVFTDQLDVGRSSFSASFTVNDDDYPDCFYYKDKTLFISVRIFQRDCVALTGDKFRISNSDGNCVCITNAIAIRGRCHTYFSLLCAILFPLAFLLSYFVYRYVERKKEQADSVWTVHSPELIYDDPPKVLGRGSFGLVVLAEYRGTQVAVKRVLPKHMDLLPTGSTSLTSCRRSPKANLKVPALFDFPEEISQNMEEQGLVSSLSVNTYGSTKRKSFWHKLGGRSTYDQLRSDFVSEMRLLSKLRHPCITTVMGAVLCKDEPLLVMEYMEYGSLYDLLHNSTIVIEGNYVLPILRNIVQGIRFLHSATPEVIHGDLKAQNILVDVKFRAKVADFGLSNKKHDGVTGSPYWMAPELLRGESTNTAASDIYSLGIILYEVYSRKIPYLGEDFSNVIQLLKDPTTCKRPQAPSAMPAVIASLMSDCLLEDPGARPTSYELDARFKRFDVSCVQPGEVILSLQDKKVKRVNNLLNDIFPKHVARALSSGRKVEAENHECVTIFFSDIVGYTALSSGMSPLKISDMLDRLYTKFDLLSLDHGVFKVETIGDSWMGVTNLWDLQLDFTKQIALFSLAALSAAKETLIDLERPERGFVRIRIGLHSGPVLTNVVGARNPRYCLIGDTVNVASRMESTSIPGCIHCSKKTANLLSVQASNISIIYRGKINIKGKGNMQTYWLRNDQTL